MTHEDVVSAVRDALAKERDEFWIPQPQHYLDHQMLMKCRESSEEWKKNHEWVEAVRKNTSYGRKVGLGFIVTSLLSFLFWAVANALGLWKD